MRPINHNAEGAGFISAPPSVAPNLPRGWVTSPIADCEFLSLPRPRERCRFSNLSRTTLVELLDRGEITGLTLRRPGATRGKRLIVKRSLADYLYGLAKSAAVTAGSKTDVSS